MLFPGHAFTGLVTGTVIFSLAAGLGEVLVSPTVEALPSDTHDRDLAALHFLYGYGLVISLHISKAIGDIFGLMLFAVLLSLTRSWYAKYGRDIYRVLMVSMVGAIFCYMAAGGDMGASIASDEPGMKVGMLVAAIFPVIGVGVLLLMRNYFKKAID